MYIYHLCAGAHGGQKRETNSLGSTVPDGYEPPDVSTEKCIWVLFKSSKYSIA